MSVGFRAVQWNKSKIIYDVILLTAVALFIGVFLLIAYRIDPPKDLPAAIDLRSNRVDVALEEESTSKAAIREERTAAGINSQSDRGEKYGHRLTIVNVVTHGRDIRPGGFGELAQYNGVFSALGD